MKYLYSKTVLLVILFNAFVLMPGITEAQSIKEKKADKYYESFAYSKAVEVYQDLFASDNANPKYIQRIAYCYNKMLKYRQALIFYSRLVQLDIAQPTDYYEYAQLLHTDGRDAEAKLWLEKYMIKSPGDQRAIKQLDNINRGGYRTSIDNVTVKNLPGNTRFTDMCATYFKDQLVYSSAKDSFSMVKNVYDWDNQPFLDMYVTKPGAGPAEKDSRSMFASVNTRFHEGAASFTSDWNTMYFTRNNYLNGRLMTTPDGTNNLKVFVADFNGKEWKNLRSLPFNSEKYSVGHPALSPDNKTLYFISDMPGGFGQTDIYKCEWNNGSWGNPVNLGETINTSGKEMFPYVDKEGILYFSSDGHPGQGGLDVFAAKEEKPGVYKVVNVVAPINSAFDDFGLVINNDSLTGYFTSNRTGGKGQDDIYSYVINKIDLRVLVYDDLTKQILPGSKVALKSEGNVIDTQMADKNGAVMFSVKPRSKYQLLAENTIYSPQTKDIQVKGSLFDFVQHEDIYLKQAAPYLTIEVIDKESGLIIPHALVDITKGKYNESELEDNNGIIKMKLAENTDYAFNATAEEYFDKTAEFTSKGKPAGEYTLTIEMEKLSTGKQFVLEDLFYDLNKYNIRPDAAIVLDKLAKILKDNPSVRIEIGSHTDSRATAEYNLKLSQNRSESVVAYLISKGIDKSRLVAKGYGESQLVNKCADGVPCTEEEHQANRRTVIEILNPEIRRVKRGTKNVYYF
ncbi:MAG TPA: OmpA family protein [Prolixibacteraceae bacterium]|nr:OmpA family protein [Prolixibacteraceae bacterium]